MNKLVFYDIIWYNYPKNKEYFYLNKELAENIKYKSNVEKKLSSDTSKLEKIINKYSFLYKQIPFVKAIFVCNSLTFRSIHKDSDIDLFIITKENKLFLAKFFVWLFLKIFRIYWNHEKWKFCAWFWITEIAQDLYPITIYPVDLYLAYWIAHLQPLYCENPNQVNDIFKENIWVKRLYLHIQTNHKRY